MSFLSKIFSKKFQDEALDDQRKEVEDERKELEEGTGLKMSELKEGCDQILGANGEFGHDIRNPIPVNGIRGGIKYLNRLRCQCGAGLIFHRPGSKESENNDGNTDIFETVCVEGKHWDILYLNIYYLRRSVFLPKGYHFSDFDQIFSKFPIGFGTNYKCDNFPFEMPKMVARGIGGTLGEKFADKLEIIIGDGTKFRR
jgi:hypothetical protein